jgi:addiction module HigA family antidote
MTRTKQRSTERSPTHPGAFLREIVLPAVSASKVEIAAALGISRQSLYDILSEKQPVTPGMAVRLGIVFETSSASWLRMQAAYDLWHAEREIDASKLHPLPKAG